MLALYATDPARRGKPVFRPLRAENRRPKTARDELTTPELKRE